MRINRRGTLGAVILAAMVLFFQEGFTAKEEQPRDSKTLRESVEAYLSANDEDNAASLLTEILSSEGFSDIRDWATAQYYGLAQKKDGIEPAVKKLEATGKNSKNAGLHKSIADGYVRLGDWTEVVKIYEKLLKDNPDDSVLNTRLIDAYLMDKNYNALIKILEPRVALNPNDIASSDILAHAYLGAQKADEVVALYKQRIQKEPNSPGLRGRYAQSLLDLGMPEESLAEWNAAFKLDPLNLLFKQRVAEVYMQMGKTKEAEKEYKELLSLIPQNQSGFKDAIAARIRDVENMKQ